MQPIGLPSSRIDAQNQGLQRHALRGVHSRRRRGVTHRSLQEEDIRGYRLQRTAHHSDNDAQSFTPGGDQPRVDGQDTR